MSHDLSEAIWGKSSRSGSSGGECVEIAQGAQLAGVRDSKNQEGPALTFRPTELVRFLNAVKAGRLDH